MEPEDFWGTVCARGWKEKKRSKEYAFLCAAPLHSGVNFNVGFPAGFCNRFSLDPDGCLVRGRIPQTN
ncbi:MAG: hypothetical protein CO090_08955 [Acidobacteria bacterium CG_4_9_14_3_um_filter_49_7]|nr:MAG: hypothetical protein CO090_08955 [Acidobacteria bacterium CG_4_9_14_3_um_filter_49_7]